MWIRLWRVLRGSIYTSPLLWWKLAIISLNKWMVICFVKLASDFKISLVLLLFITRTLIQLTYFSFFIYFFHSGIVRWIDDHVRVVNFEKRCGLLSKVRNIIGVSILLFLDFVSHNVVQILCIIIQFSDFLMFWILVGVI